MPRTGRREQPLVTDGPLSQFAAELRRMRERAGLTYNQLAEKAGLSAATLRAAAGGTRPPTWEVTRAFSDACDGDESTIRPLWEAGRLAAGRTVPAEPPAEPPDPQKEATAADLVDMLKQLRAWAKYPSFGELNRRADGHNLLPPSTVWDMLRSQRLPRLELMVAFARACGLEEDQVTAWTTAWESIKEREKAVYRQRSAVADFAGRDAELEKLTSFLEEAALPGGTVVIAIDGKAGIGKTALARQWTHQVAAEFPHGQLYVNLRGDGQAETPMTGAEAVRGFLDDLKVPAEQIPVDPDRQAALYRSLLAGQRVLIVLDNAHDSEQVRPLLPGQPGGSVVVVTSRDHLADEIADARSLTVEPLTDPDARLLLECRLGSARIEAQQDAVREIIDRCAGLPLALSVVAARAAAHPEFPLTALADELRARGPRVIDAGEEVPSAAAAVFSWSYKQLSEQAARMFRLLGLHPGPDITVPAAASLAAVPVPEAQHLMDELAHAHLIIQHVPGRFTFHDLVRAYATDLAEAHDPGTGQQAAQRRMLDHYLHTAQRAWSLSSPHLQRSITLSLPSAGVTPEEPVGYSAAWAWFTAEYPVLIAAIQLAAGAGHYTHAWQLPHTLVPFFERQGYWRDFDATHDTALTAARDHADELGQAHAHLGIGHARTRRGRRLDEARPHLQDALRLFKELDDPAGQAVAHSWLGMTFSIQKHYEEALTHSQQALDLARTGGYQRNIAAALNSLGWNHALRGDAQQALPYCRQSLALFQDLLDRWGEAAVLNSIGCAHHRLGRHREAVSYFKRAIAIDGELGGDDLYSKATDYDHLGNAHHAAGDFAEAYHAWRQALDILDQLGDVPRMGPGYADPDAIRAKLPD